jgi:hypothetical protein
MLIAFALIGIATELDDAHENRSHNRGVGIAMVIICAGAGAMLVRAARRAPAGAVPRASEIIRVAQKHGGRITAAEVAADTTIPFDEAKGELDRLAKAGACEVVVGDAGILVYRFPEFESAANKQDSV